MALTGSLAEIEAADLMQLIAMGRKSGVLSVDDGSRRNVFYFRDGQVVHAVSSDDQPPVEVVYQFVGQSTGRFRFEGRVPECEDTIKQSTESLVLEGMRRLDHERRIEQHLPDEHCRVVVGGDRRAGGEMTLNSDQARVLLLVDGERTIGEIVRESQLSRLSALEALGELLDEGIVQALPAAERPRTPPPEPRRVQTPPRPGRERQLITTQILQRVIDHLEGM